SIRLRSPTPAIMASATPPAPIPLQRDARSGLIPAFYPPPLSVPPQRDLAGDCASVSAFAPPGRNQEWRPDALLRAYSGARRKLKRAPRVLLTQRPWRGHAPALRPRERSAS